MSFGNKLEIKGMSLVREYPGLMVVAIIIFTVVSRMLFMSDILYHWDSVNFANGITEFDVLKEHPQPPGYILYIWFARLVNLAFHDVNQTLVAISIGASAGAVVVIYLLGRDLWNEEVGIIASLFLATSPLFWFYGEIALPHSLDLFLILLSLWTLYRVRTGSSQFLWPAVFILGIAGGVRQQTLVFLLPVTLYAVWREGWKRILIAAILGSVVCVVWFLPLIENAGGLEQYFGFMSDYSARFQWDTSILMGAGISGVLRNLKRLLPYTLYALGAAILPLAFIPQLRKWDSTGGRRSEQVRFFLLWLSPVVLFYIFIHMGQQGLIFVYLPGFFLLGGLILQKTKFRPWLKYVVITAILLTNSVIFVLVPERALNPFVARLLTADTIRNSDQYYNERIGQLEECCPPDKTLVFSSNWEHVRYYLPQYSVMGFMAGGIVSFPDQPGGQELTGVAEINPLDLHPGISGNGPWWVAFFDENIESFSVLNLTDVNSEIDAINAIGYAILDPQDVVCVEENEIDICEPDWSP